MKKILFYIIVTISVFQIGCRGITDGLVIDLEIPEHDPILTPYCFINAADSTVEVMVQKSQGALEALDERYVQNATVELYKNGTLWNTIPFQSTDHDQNGLYKLQLDEAFEVEGFGDTYELRVSSPDFETNTATQVMPSPVMPISIEYNEQGGTSPFGDILDVVRVTFDDPADVENYYLIDLYVKATRINEVGDTVGESESWSSVVSGNNPSITQGYGGVIVKDDLFDGERITLDVGTWASSSSLSNNSDFTSVGVVTVVLYSITRDEYLYQKSLETYANSQGLFSEPTLIHSNMSQGLGAFTMMVSSKQEFTF